MYSSQSQFKYLIIRHTYLANLIVTNERRVRLFSLDFYFWILPVEEGLRGLGKRLDGVKEINEPFPKSIKVEDSKYHCLLQHLTIGYL